MFLRLLGEQTINELFNLVLFVLFSFFIKIFDKVIFTFVLEVIPVIFCVCCERVAITTNPHFEF